MAQLKNLKIGRNALRAVITIFMAVCLLVGIVCFQYYKRIQVTIREESSGYLQEVTKRIGNNINRIIDSNYAVLDTLAAVMVNQNISSFEAVRPVVEIQKGYWNFKEIMLIDGNGVAYNSSGREISISSDVYLQNAVINKKQSMSASQMVGNEETVVFAIPLDNMVIDGKTMVAMASSYAPDVFDQVLAMTAFEGKATCNIIGKDGSNIVRSSSQYALRTGYNLLTSLETAQFVGKDSVEQILNDMKANKVGQVQFTYEGAESYMVYTPINPEDWYLTTFVPVEIVNAKSDMLLNITVLLCGSITLLFAGLMAFLTYNFYRNQNKLEQIAYVDEVTGGNTIQKFYELAQIALSEPGHPKYALIFTNIEKFKILNEQIGRRTCDTILKTFYDCVQESLIGKECMGRLSADNFCVLLQLENEEALLARFAGWYEKGEVFLESQKAVWGLPVTDFGILIIDNDNMPFTQMVDRAKLALRKSCRTHNGRIRYAYYDDELRRNMFREKHLEDMMEDAINNNEFQVYLQPKYRVQEETIGGAEALTRWVSKAEGMIYPDEFIPLFEKNGFIIRLDVWVFEEVCKTLRMWLDEGKKPVKISVNCSRVHLRDPDFMKPYKKLSEKYNIPYGLLEIELTESVVMDDTENLSKIIGQIHDAGFGCSMDDFGSGYSSLNLIQSIPVDTLKLDKIFFKSKDEDRVQSVVGGITTMAIALNMETVAEGVEYREQVEMLKRIGCNYIQGYVFAKPMPIPDFEKLLFGTSK